MLEFSISTLLLPVEAAGNREALYLSNYLMYTDIHGIKMSKKSKWFPRMCRYQAFIGIIILIIKIIWKVLHQQKPL